MIEHVIAGKLLSDPKVRDYCGDSVFAVMAPDGTKCPYIAITESDRPASSDVVIEFDITVEIYDYNKDKRLLIDLGQHIKKILHYADDLEDSNGIYSNIRVYYQGRDHTREPDSSLSRMFISFSVRAIEDVAEKKQDGAEPKPTKPKKAR